MGYTRTQERAAWYLRNRGFSQRDAAKVIGIGHSTLKKWLRDAELSWRR